MRKIVIHCFIFTALIIAILGCGDSGSEMANTPTKEVPFVGLDCSNIGSIPKNVYWSGDINLDVNDARTCLVSVPKGEYLLKEIIELLNRQAGTRLIKYYSNLFVNDNSGDNLPIFISPGIINMNIWEVVVLITKQCNVSIEHAGNNNFFFTRGIKNLAVINLGPILEVYTIYPNSEFHERKTLTRRVFSLKNSFSGYCTPLNSINEELPITIEDKSKIILKPKKCFSTSCYRQYDYDLKDFLQNAKKEKVLISFNGIGSFQGAYKSIDFHLKQGYRKTVGDVTIEVLRVDQNIENQLQITLTLEWEYPENLDKTKVESLCEIRNNLFESCQITNGEMKKLLSLISLDGQKYPYYEFTFNTFQINDERYSLISAQNYSIASVGAVTRINLVANDISIKELVTKLCSIGFQRSFNAPVKYEVEFDASK